MVLSDESPSARSVAIAVLALGVFAVSISSVLVRLAQAEGVPSVAIAMWRLVLAAMLMVPLLLMRRPTAMSWDRKSIALACVAGVLLALHFAFWIVALESMSIAVCAALLATNPIWVGAIAAVLFGERIGRQAWWGGALTVACAIALATDLGTANPRSSTLIDIFGGLSLAFWLAIGSAVAFAGYLLCGRTMRHQIDLSIYFASVTTAAALVLVGYAWISGVAMAGYSMLAWMCLFGLAAIPHLLGHGAFNWATRRMPAFPVAAASLAEPVFASVFAWLVFSEVVPMGNWPSLIGILAGVGIVLHAALAHERRI